MQIAVIAHSYPSKGTPTAATFVQVIARGFAKAGHEVVVVRPVPFPRVLKRNLFPEVEVDEESGIKVLCPGYLSFSGKMRAPLLGVFNPARWSFENFSRSAVSALKRIDFTPDIVYGHFMYFGGGGAVEVGIHFGVPSFVGVGEGEFWSIKPLGEGFAKRHLSNATCLVPNATHLGDSLHEVLEVPFSKIAVLPNGIDPRVFFPRDKDQARKKFDIPSEKFVVGGVGNYNYKKGICRVGEAIEGMDGVVGAFAGSGDAPPVASNIVFSKRILHSELPEFYSACDVFVLPTLVEGCCNALIEAMACGLPIISSNTKYTSDLLDDTCSIRVDPLDIKGIRAAIERLRDDIDLRNRLSAGAIERAKRFHIEDRIAKMLQIFESKRMIKGCHG